MFFFRFRRTNQVASLKPGDVAIIEGVISPKTELSLPHTQDKCVFYSRTVEAFKISERAGRKLWLAEHYERQASGFFVDDGTGRVYVPAQPSVTEFSGGHTVIGNIDRSGEKRFFANVIRGGDRIRIHGTLDTPSGKEPKDTLVLRPAPTGILLGLRR